MDKGEALELAREYKRVISDYFHIKSLYLYGSYSKGGYTPESDIDIAVIVPSQSTYEYKDLVMLWKLGSQVSSLIEPVLINEDSVSPLYYDIRRTGIEI